MTLLATLLRRLLAAVPILLVVSVLLFLALRVLPEDPAAMSVPPTAAPEEVDRARQRIGLDRTLPEQYAIWLGQMLSGELGRSVHLHRPVRQLLGEALPATIELTGLAMLVSGVLGLAGGLLLFALRSEGGRKVGREALAETGVVLLMSVPGFLWALLFILVFGVALEAMPVAGRLAPELAQPRATGFVLLDSLLSGDLAAFASAVQHMVLPAVALGLAFAPPVMRVLAASLAGLYRADHIRQARLRGLSEARVLLGHALRDAALPAVALIGAQCGYLLGGAVLLEVIFSYPGMGALLVAAVRHADLPVIQAAGLAYCAVLVLVHALAEGLCLALNPRLRTP